MAGLQNIPRELYEAAAIDGAGVWQQIRRITLPSLRPVNQVLVLVLFLWTFNDFNTPYVLFGKAAPGGGGPDLDPHLPVVVRHLELRHRLGDVRAAAAVPARRDRPSTCCSPPGEGGAPMPSATADRLARWRRRGPSSGPGAIVLTLLAGFVLLPVLRDAQQLAEAARRTSRASSAGSRAA